MEDVERLLKGTVEELEKLLNGRNVLGDPIDREGATVVPVVSYGFGFGAGGGTGGEGAKSGKGSGAGAGAGGGIKPLGAIIIDQNGARMEAVKSGPNSLAAAVCEAVASVVAARTTDKKAPDDTA